MFVILIYIYYIVNEYYIRGEQNDKFSSYHIFFIFQDEETVNENRMDYRKTST